MTTTIDTSSPERGWPPFMDWLRGHGVDPNECTGVELDEQAMTAVVTLTAKRSGKPYLDGNDELATEQRTIQLIGLPPRRET